MFGDDDVKDLDKENMPLHIIILSLIFIFPLGIYFIVLKVKNNLIDIKKYAKILIWCGIFFLTITLIYFLCRYGYYVRIFDSPMSLDMYNYSFIWLYVYALMVIISCFAGGISLNNLCTKLVIYTEFINVRHIKDIDLICEETNEGYDEVLANIEKLIKKGFLLNVKLVEDHIVSTKTVKDDKTKKLVKCKTCGNIKVLNDKYTHCDFCYRKLTKRDKV